MSEPRKPTVRQTAVLQFIDRFVKARGYAPSVREIGQAMGLYSTSTTAGHLKALRRFGYIDRVVQSPRTLQVTPAGREYLARIDAAGKAPVI